MINKEDLSRIEKKVSEILKIFKLEFYKNRIHELKKTIVDTIFETIIVGDISLEAKQEIIKFIEGLIKNEVVEYQSKKEYIRKELFKIYLHKILHDVDRFFKTNNSDKFEKMTLFQKKFLINHFIETINKKYLEEDFLNARLTEDNCNFLKSKIKLYIIYRYDKVLSGK